MRCCKGPRDIGVRLQATEAGCCCTIRCLVPNLEHELLHFGDRRSALQAADRIC